MADPVAASPGAVETDSFFVLRDCRELFQRRLEEILKQIGGTMPSTREAFSDALGSSYELLASNAGKAGFSQANGLTASRISLMGNDDLDLDIRIGEIGHRLTEVGGGDLWRAHMRFITLLRRPEMGKDDNPVGLEPICEGLRALCRESGGNVEASLTLLDRIEQGLREALPVLYREINDFLAARGVEPAQNQVFGVGGGAPARPAAKTEQAANPLAALQDTLRQQAGVTVPAAPAANYGSGGGGGGDAAVSAATLVMLNQLLARLEALPLPASTPEAGDLAPVPRLVKAAELGLPAGGLEAITLDTVALIFEAICDSPDLPEVLKAALSRLQIPLVKQAILDPGFFADTAHPARRFINRLGRAALGLPRSADRDHPVCATLIRLINTVADAQGSQPDALEPPLAELESLIRERDEAVLTAAEPFQALVLGLEAREAAAQAARRWLVATRHPNLPKVLNRFFDEVWVKVMETAAKDGGESGARWQAAQATANDLLWSIQPKTTPEERKQLTSMVPTLIKRLNEGLDGVAIPPEVRAPFLDACFDLQTAALRGKSEEPAGLPMPALPAIPTPTTVRGHGLLLRVISPAAEPALNRAPSTRWAVGDWLTLRLPHGETLCGRLCWTSPGSGRHLFFNPEWESALAVAPTALDQQIRDSQALRVAEIPLFDKAAEQALKRLAGG